MAETDNISPRSRKQRQFRLTVKRARFCRLVLELDNATDAYLQSIAVNANRETAAVAASRLLRRPDVLRYLNQLRDDVLDAEKITLHKILTAEAAAAFADRTKMLNRDGSLKNPRRFPKELKAVIEGIEIEEIYGTEINDDGERVRVVKSRKYKVRTAARQPAIEALMRFKKMLGPDPVDPDAKKDEHLIIVEDEDD